MYLNQLPQTEVARVKAELAETLIAHFCYPRFYDYRANALRMRPVDRAKRQEVWQYLNAVDFNVWGRVDVDSPDFQRQVERLFIHFVQRNRSFFGQQGRKRMTDVRTLITNCSSSLAEGLRGHLHGQQKTPPFGGPRPVSSWSAAKGTGPIDLPWEQVHARTTQMQVQLQEARGEIQQAATAFPTPPPIQTQPPVPGAHVSDLATRRSRSTRPPTMPTNGAANSGNSIREAEALTWPPAVKGASRPGEVRLAAPFPAPSKEGELANPQRSPLPKEPEPARPKSPSPLSSAETVPTLPLHPERTEHASLDAQQQTPTKIPATPSEHTRRMRPTAPPPSGAPFTSAPPPSGAPFTSTPPSNKAQTYSQPLPTPTVAPAPTPQLPASPMPGTQVSVKQPEGTTVLVGDEDVVIFEQMRHQLILWLRVETVRSGIELNGQPPFQLVEVLRHQDGMDLTRLQVISTLLNMCNQIINSGRASLFDYKQAMMFYLMHTRRSH